MSTDAEVLEIVLEEAEEELAATKDFLERHGPALRGSNVERLYHVTENLVALLRGGRPPKRMTTAGRVSSPTDLYRETD